MYWRICRNPTTDQMNLYNIVSIYGLVLLSSPIAAFSPGAQSLQSISFPSQSKRYLLPSPTQSLAHRFVSTTNLLFTPKEESDASNDDKPFIRPALHNSPFFRSLAILYALLFAIYQGSSPDSIQKVGKLFILSPKNAATVHLLSFSVFFGTTVYTTFIAGITMFKNLPRRVFGKLQSKLFPLYFQLCTVMLGLQILTLTSMPDILSKTSEVSLAVSFVSTLLNLLYLEPTSTKVMFDRYQLEDDGKKDSDEYSEKAKSFGKLHGMSSLANLVSLLGGLIHGVRLASGLAI